ncbi:DUF4142 domain-containing protein [Sphingobacterium oryzagri]|uniref:DUF4142 domain-containing protein n=1 Tax=Sphingobacterium oryzagri TaxID=3025669 RepID=A0ABY7WBC9_9SPHI|nr:DUF4142 domain-containing protein [Sphingobacterium sp. KACC 22765]WDF66949.1 DUF4142 domain-containing protein [Sphingobacterium sp. KACC 22765]
MRNSIYTLVAAVLIGLSSCGNNSHKVEGDSDSINEPKEALLPADGHSLNSDTLISDTAFVRAAAQSGMAEVIFGKLALEVSEDARIKEFADMMVKDHGKANSELSAIASSNNITVPDELDAAHTAKLTALRSKKGIEFDRSYAEAMIEGHEKTRDLLEKARDGVQDEKLKGFAQKTLPTVLHHLEFINTIKSEMK